MNFSLENLLVLDIETVRSHKIYEEMPERLQAQWDRKASFLRKVRGETFNSSATVSKVRL